MARIGLGYWLGFRFGFRLWSRCWIGHSWHQPVDVVQILLNASKWVSRHRFSRFLDGFGLRSGNLLWLNVLG